MPFVCSYPLGEENAECLKEVESFPAQAAGTWLPRVCKTLLVPKTCRAPPFPPLLDNLRSLFSSNILLHGANLKVTTGYYGL